MPGPGVIVTTAVRSGGSQLKAPSGTLFLVGQAERGDTSKPVEVRGLADYVDLFGGRVTYGNLYDQVRTFFAEGGVRAFIVRTVGPAADVGTLTLEDRAGSPLDTLKIDAANEGAWSSRLKVQIANGTNADTFRVIVTLDDEIVEDKNNLANPSAAVAAFALSNYIRVTDLGSATAAPNNNPAVLAATPLSAGDDDRASITATHYEASLDLISPEFGDGAVAAPGLGSTVHQPLIDHAEANNRIALLAGGVGDSISTLKGLADDYDSDAAGLFAPWIVVSDEAGGTRQISPEGYVAGKRAVAHERTGPWQAPAGVIAASNSILDVVTTFTRAEAEELDAARVSVIRKFADGVRLYGWRSLSTDDQNFPLLSARDVLNYLVIKGEDLLEQFVFAPIDARGQVLSSVNAALVGLVEPIRQAGGLFENIDSNGRVIDPGYAVDTGTNLNTPTTLAQNRLRARLSVRVAPTGALVELTIVKVGVLSTF